MLTDGLLKSMDSIAEILAEGGLSCYHEGVTDVMEEVFRPVFEQEEISDDLLDFVNLFETKCYNAVVRRENRLQEMDEKLHEAIRKYK